MLWNSFQNSVNAPKNDGEQAKGTIDVKITVIAHDQTTAVIIQPKQRSTLQHWR
jgi:hypothetical protein